MKGIIVTEVRVGSIDAYHGAKPSIRRLTGAGPRLQGGIGGLHPGKQAFGHGDLGRERSERRAGPGLDDASAIAAAIGKGVEQPRRAPPQRAPEEYLDCAGAIAGLIHRAVLATPGSSSSVVVVIAVAPGVQTSGEQAGVPPASGVRH